jgi:hypothetical protein
MHTTSLETARYISHIFNFTISVSNSYESGDSLDSNCTGFSIMHFVIKKREIKTDLKLTLDAGGTAVETFWARFLQNFSVGNQFWSYNTLIDYRCEDRKIAGELRGDIEAIR